MGQLRALMSVFSDFQGFDGWKIGEVCMARREEEACGTAPVCRKRDGYAVLEAAQGRFWMQLHLVRGKASGAAKQGKSAAGRLPGAECLAARKRFDAGDILSFVRETGDGNRIHREDPPVVPGLLILEWLWEDGLLRTFLPETVRRPSWKLSLRFYSVLFAGEETAVYTEGAAGMAAAVRRAGEEFLVWKLTAGGR